VDIWFGLQLKDPSVCWVPADQQWKTNSSCQEASEEPISCSHQCKRPH
jgi:hypothetical protein